MATGMTRCNSMMHVGAHYTQLLTGAVSLQYERASKHLTLYLIKKAFVCLDPS